MKTQDLATLLVVAPAGTLNLAASDGPSQKLATLLSGLSEGASVTVRSATSEPATIAYPVGVRGVTRHYKAWATA
jgi:hypothetical protein